MQNRAYLVVPEGINVVEPVAVRRATAAAMLDCSESTVLNLEKSNKLKTILVGKDRRITVESIREFAAVKAAA